MRRLAATLLGLALAAGLAADSSQDGGQPAAFLKMGWGARSLGMGSAYAALADEPHGLLSNPAGAAQSQELVVGMSTAAMPEGRSAQYLGLTRGQQLGGKQVGYGVGWGHARVAQGLERRTKASPEPEGSFEASDNAIELCGAGWVWREQLALGLGLKALVGQLADANSSGFAADLGALYRPLPRLTLGVVAADLFGQVAWSTGSSEELPMTLKLAGAYRLAGLPLSVAAQVDKPLQQGLKLRLGLEAAPFEGRFMVRGGLDNGAPALGLGARLDLAGFSGQLDYALAGDRSRDFDLLDPMHRVSLTLAFGS